MVDGVRGFGKAVREYELQILVSCPRGSLATLSRQGCFMRKLHVHKSTVILGIDSFDVVAWFCLSRVQSQGRATRN